MQKISSKLKNIKRQGDGYTALCPAHDDNKNSLSISQADDGKILLYCHAGCRLENILRAIGIEMEDLFPKKQKSERRVVATYDYTDLQGKLIHQTIRFEPKSFAQRRPDGKGGWIYNLKNIKPVLYKLPEVITAIKEGKIIFIVEGEKDVDNMYKLSLIATSSPMGSGKWRDEHSDYLKGAKVVIIPDNDEAGKKHAEQVAKSLYNKAKIIKIIELPDIPEKGDITDYFHLYGHKDGLQMLNDMIEITGMWKPENEWEPPEPFDICPDLSPFPVAAFPDWVQDYVDAVAEETQTPVDMAAVIALGILSIPCNKVYRIEGKPGWQEPTNLFTCLIARPGERKSAVLMLISNPIYEYEVVVNKELQANIQKSQAEKDILQEELSKLKKKAAQTGDVFNRKEAMDKAEELSKFEEVRPIRLISDDTTPERLANLLSENNGRMAIVSSEGGIFDIMSGRYSQAMNIDVFLKGHAGDPIIIDRMNRNSDYIRNPALTLVLTIQPDVLNGLMQNTTLRGRGMTARFLYSIPESKVGARNIKSKSIPWRVKELYSNNLKRMFRVIPEGSILLTLSEDAYQLSIEFARRLEPRLIDDLEHIADWASKLHGAILRIAAILHVAENVTSSTSSTLNTLVSKDTFKKAVLIGKYFLLHALPAFNMMGCDKDIENCKYVLCKIKHKSMDILSRNDIRRLCRKKELEKIEGLEPVIKILCDRNYLMEFEKVRAGAVKKIDKYYKVNPHFLNSNECVSRAERAERKKIITNVRYVKHADNENENYIKNEEGEQACPF